ALRRSPGFAAVAVLVLSLGLAASIATYTALDATYFSALPYGDVSRLVAFVARREGPGCTPVCVRGITPREAVEWGPQVRAAEAIVAVGNVIARIQANGGEEIRTVGAVSGNFLSTFQLKPMLGRELTRADDRAGADPVVVLSYSFWQQAL